MSDQPETRTEEWVHTGVRVSSKGKRVTTWQVPSGKAISFIERKSYITGGVYTVKVSDAEGGGIVRHGDPRWDHRYDNDDDVAQWRAREVAAEAALAHKVNERAAAKRDALNEAMNPLVNIARTLRTSAERDAFIAHIINRITQEAWWTR
jgi:hypothetical protein